MATAQVGGPDVVLPPETVRDFVQDALGGARLGGRSVCVVVPDATRACPLPQLISAIYDGLHGLASRLTVLVALGTHAAMDDGELWRHLGYDPAIYPGMTVHNHEWWDPGALTTIGTIPAARVRALSEGRLDQDLVVEVNRAVVEHDVTIVVGPVLPHEVVGFSGGNKYLFPGVSGRRFVDLSHWLGALITSWAMIGRPGVTPVRALIDEAAAMVPSRRLAFCLVTGPPGYLRALSFGPPEEAWASAVEVSAECHVSYLERPVRRVLSILAPRYDDMWTGAKGFYKVEPVVADGGQVVIYAPHIAQLSRTHPAIAEIGYHCRDFFVKQWDLYKEQAWGDLAHSTHLRGAGTFDPASGEANRVTVTLATAIPEEVVRSVNLDYLDPGQVDIADWDEDPAALVVPDAGEHLFRLRPAPARTPGDA